MMDNAPEAFDTEQAKIIGLVLAGGASSRMGQDKATLSIGRRTLVSIAKRCLLDSGVDRVIVSSNHLSNALADKIHHCGPLSAIHSIVNEPWINQYQGMLVLPVDMPLIQSAQLRLLRKKGQILQTSCCFEQSYLPAYIPFADGLLNTVEQQMKSGDYAVKRLLAKLDYHQLTTLSDTSDSTNKISSFHNINTPEQWQCFLKASQSQTVTSTCPAKDS